MRRPVTLRVALALLQRVSGGANGEALCGDLLEEFARTGSTNRLWREIAAALLRGVWRRSWEWLQPLAFSAGWSLMYPVWRGLEGGRVWPTLAQQGFTMDWPYSSMALLASAGMSPLLFVWCGALLYLARNAREESWTVRWFRIVRGLSLSLSVLLVSGMVLLSYAGDEGMTGRLAGEAAYAPGVPVSWLRLALTLSLLVATFPARPMRLQRRWS